MPNQNNQASSRDKDLAAQAHCDDPRQAIESGEPRIAGHQGTRVIEDDEGLDNTTDNAKRSNPGEQAR